MTNPTPMEAWEPLQEGMCDSKWSHHQGQHGISTACHNPRVVVDRTQRRCNAEFKRKYGTQERNCTRELGHKGNHVDTAKPATLAALVAKWRMLTTNPRNGAGVVQQAVLNMCADDLEAALSTCGE